MIDIRTLLFANAVVFAVLAVAMILVWRGNRSSPGLASLARVHVTMMAGAALVGVPPGTIPAFLSVFAGNALVVLSVIWLLDGFQKVYGERRGRWPWVLFGVWAAGLLAFQYVLPSLRARILLTSCLTVILLSRAAWTARLGLRRPEDRRPSLLILGSLGLLAAVFAARSVGVAVQARVSPMGDDALIMALLTVSLVAGTGWTLGVMNLVYARLNEERNRYETGLKQLVQVAAHEIRTPLTSVHGTLAMLAGGALVPGDRERLLAVAQRSSERMIRLLDDLLDLERVESGQAELRLEGVDLERVLRQASELSEGQAKRLGVRLELAVVPGARVRADPQRLLQVVINLLSNAVKFSPPGEAVQLSMARLDGVVRVEVKDQGPGIPAELRHRIFQRFARGTEPAAREARKGSGLGLAISKALIEGMGGRIGFESGERTGTIFYFELPAIST